MEMKEIRPRIFQCSVPNKTFPINGSYTPEKSILLAAMMGWTELTLIGLLFRLKSRLWFKVRGAALTSVSCSRGTMKPGARGEADVIVTASHITRTTILPSAWWEKLLFYYK